MREISVRSRWSVDFGRVVPDTEVIENWTLRWLASLDEVIRAWKGIASSGVERDRVLKTTAGPSTSLGMTLVSVEQAVIPMTACCGRDGLSL